MDPNQRGLLETTYHALENAGIGLQDIAGTNTSVHVACFSNDFTTWTFRDIQNIPKYAATGASQAILSNRISWFLNIHGPSMTIDTACSGGLVALDTACQGLWAGRSDTAIVGAPNLILSPEMNVSMSHMNFLSKDGKCFSFDHRANGYGRGEGFATLIIKPLSKALAAGNNVRALIRSVVSNQDGKTVGGITQPSKDMQAKLIRDTYAKANLDMSKTRFFEAHGTGTTLGDPIEANAIGSCFARHRSSQEPLYVGALKSNLGHLEGASGLASVIKTVLALERGVIPPNTNFKCPNPNIDSEFWHLEFPCESKPWPEVDIRRASVNSFGFGGSNAHVVLDAYPHRGWTCGQGISQLPTPSVAGLETGAFVPTSKKGSKHLIPPSLLVFSAFDANGIQRQLQAHAEFWKQRMPNEVDDTLPDVAYTLAGYRSPLAWKSFAIVESSSQLLELEAMASEPSLGVREAPRLGIVFTGQGAQWSGMARELLDVPVFEASIHCSQTYLDKLGCTWSLHNLLSGNCEPLIHEARFSQTLTTSIQLALVDLMNWLEIKPSIVIGHSSGEIAAAYAAGHISAYTAIRIAYYRGLFGSSLEITSKEPYAMAAIGLSESELNRQLRNIGGSDETGGRKLTISCINSPSNVTVSGPESAVDAVVSLLRTQGTFARRLKVKLGYHSPQMAQISNKYLKALGDLDEGTPTPNRPLMVSTVTSAIADCKEVCSGQYWARNMTSTVDFLGAMQLCVTASSATVSLESLDRPQVKLLRTDGWLELGPHSSLQGPIREILASASMHDFVYTSSLVRGQSALFSVLSAVGHLYCNNFSVAVAKATSLGLSIERADSRRIQTHIPRYQFDHSILYWDESKANLNFRLRPDGYKDNLGWRTSDTDVFERQWKLAVKEDDMPWVSHHQVNGVTLYPAAGMLVMALEAARQLHFDSTQPIQAFEFEDVRFQAPIVITEPTGAKVKIHMSGRSRGNGNAIDYGFHISVAKPDGGQKTVCSGTVRADCGRALSDVDNGREETEKAARAIDDYNSVSTSCTHAITRTTMYRLLFENVGLQYGPSFQALEDIRYGKSGCALATLLPYDDGSFVDNLVHPSRLDGIFQLSLAALEGMHNSTTMIPTRLQRMRICVTGLGRRRPKSEVEKVIARAIENRKRSAKLDITCIVAPLMNVVAEVEGLELTAVAEQSSETAGARIPGYLCSNMVWEVDLDTLDDNQIRQYCEEARPAETESPRWFENMHDVSFQFGLEALKEIDDRHEGAVAPSMEKYTDWLRHCAQSSPSVCLDVKALNICCEELLPGARAAVVIAVGRQLSRILTGATDPLEVIYGDHEQISAFYREVYDMATNVAPLRRYIDCMTHKRPDLRFLEVGAGSGAMTKTILSTIARNGIPAFQEYMFTDLGPSFLEKAREQFAGVPRLQYSILNIEIDPIAQGFEAGRYDVIVADNVLHATENLTTSLIHIRRLLKPGGKLILKESTTPELFENGFMFGLLPGWWPANEEWRKMSPIASERQWDRLMRDTGFSGTDLVFPDSHNPAMHQWSFMISTAQCTYALPKDPK